MGSGMMYPGGAGNMGYVPPPQEDYSSISPQVQYDQQVAAAAAGYAPAGQPVPATPPSEYYDNATYGGTMAPTAVQTPGTYEQQAQLDYAAADLLATPVQYGVATPDPAMYPGGSGNMGYAPPAFPPQPSMQSQQVDAFLQSFPGGGGMAANSALGYPSVSPVAARPAIGARPGDVVDQNSDGRIDMPPPLPNTTWGGMMESTPSGGYSMPLNLPRTSDPGFIQPSVTQTAPYPATTWGSMQRDPIGGMTVPMGAPVSDPGYVAPRVVDIFPGLGMGGPIPVTPPPLPGGGPPVGNPRNTGASPNVNPSIISGQSWDTSSGYGSVERSRAGYDIPAGSGAPIVGPADAGQRWAPDPGPTVNWDVIDEINRRAREGRNNTPVAPPPPPPSGTLPGAPAPAPAAAPPVGGMAPAPAAQGTPLITPTGEVYGTLTTNAQGQTVVKKLPKNAPNRWNIPQLPVTQARQAVPAPQTLPPGVTQTVAPGFPLPPNFLPPAWAEQAQGPAMPQLPRANGGQGGGGRKKKNGR